MFPTRLFLLCCLLFSLPLLAQKGKGKPRPGSARILTAAERPDQYLHLLRGKRVAVFANQTSVAGPVHLVDLLKKAGIRIQVIFGPEHGFRGNAPDGVKIETTRDAATGVPVVSLYGQKNKPAPEDLKDVDIMVYDIQDVGVRFYTYISSLQYYMEAAIENNIPLLILDRPNPNGFYVDGPVLDPKFKSFVGMQPIPVVYGMTIGEYARMLLEEGWLSEQAMEAYTRNVLAATYPPGATYFSLKVVPCANYTHQSRYVLPVKPSPNLPDMQSVYWYPSTCFFEGTTLSEGRGTPKPFQIFGHPSLPPTLYAFTPTATEGAPNPKHKNKRCFGWNLGGTTDEVLRQVNNKVQIQYLLEAYRLFPNKDSFFIRPNGINRLAGTDQLMQQVKDGVPEAEIRKSWEPKLAAFRTIRKKYLIYPDFK
jgi:uncharacterized protein YbbC (DUF1343 family)